MIPHNNGSKVNWFKGKTAESIIEELFHDCKYNVFRMGYESILKNLAQLRGTELNRKCLTTKILSSFPDFAVVDQKGDPFIIEVKYRTYRKGRYWFIDTGKTELADVLKRWNALLVLITNEKPYFRVIDKNMILEEKSIPLQECKELSVPVEIIKKYETHVENLIIHAGMEMMNGTKQQA